MENRKVSIIIPIYNVEKYLKKCLDSVVRQTYTNLEIILVNDGSTDDSKKIAEKYMKDDERIILINKKNGGLSDARNYGIEKASGEYITFIDSDDEITEDYVEYLMSLIKKYNTKISIASYRLVCEEKSIDYGKGYEEEKITEKECLKRMLLDEGFTVSAWAKMYKVELFNNVKYPVGKIYEDNDTTYRLIMQCNEIAYGPKDIYFYYKRKGSITSGKFNDSKYSIIEFSDIMGEKILDKYPDLINEVERKKIESRFCVLRQMNKDLNTEQKKKQKEIIGYLRSRAKQILFYSCFDKREKFAIISLCFGKRFFYFIWKLYSYIKY